MYIYIYMYYIKKKTNIILKDILRLARGRPRTIVSIKSIYVEPMCRKTTGNMRAAGTNN